MVMRELAYSCATLYNAIPAIANAAAKNTTLRSFAVNCDIKPEIAKEISPSIVILLFGEEAFMGASSPLFTHNNII